MRVALLLTCWLGCGLVAAACSSRAGSGDGAGASTGSAGLNASGAVGHGASAGTVAAGGSAGSGGSTGVGSELCPAPGSFMIDDLERQALWGYWFTFHDATPGGVQSPSGAVRAEQDPTQGFALHTSGSGFMDWGAGVGLSLTSLRACFDLGRTDGLRFMAKGPGTIAVGAVVPGTIPVADGGTCEDTIACFDTHRASVALSPGWAEYEVSWSSLQQDGWGTPVVFQPYAVLSLQFSVAANQMPFDYWLDEIELREGSYAGTGGSSGNSGGTGGSSATGGSGGGGGGTVEGELTKVLSYDQFNQMFPDRNSFYTYEGLVTAASKFPAFATEGDTATRQREVAAFLANVARETGMLIYTEEISPQGIYCAASADYPCAPGKSYHGRGPLQISWNYNYGPAGEALGLNLLANPDLVSTDPAVAWETALWFWMTSAPQGKTAHQVMVNNQGFGGTIQLVNGAVECGGGNAQAVQERVTHYLDFTSLLVVAPGDSLYC